MADYQQRLAERLIHERERRSYSQDELALRAGVNPKTIKRIEEKQVERPRKVTLRRLAEGLEIEPEVLSPPEELEEDRLQRLEAKVDEIHAMLQQLVGDDQAEEAAELADEGTAEASPSSGRLPGKRGAASV